MQKDCRDNLIVKVNKHKVEILALVVLLMILLAGGAAHGQVKKDTLPKFEKIIVMSVPQQYFAPTLDSIGLVINQLGRSMSVDDSDNWKKFFQRQFGKLISDVRLDSVNVNPQPILKPKK